jgi:hypothetical protein
MSLTKKIILFYTLNEYDIRIKTKNAPSIV